MKIFIGADHAGYELKEKLKIYLSGLGYEIIDKGAFKHDAGDDYPDFIKPVAEAVSKNKESKGVIIGGTGQGEAMCANKFPNVRATVYYGPYFDMNQIFARLNKKAFDVLKLTRDNNDANILSLGARFISTDEAKKIVKLWLETPFSGDERHIRRINKLEPNA